MSSPFLPRAASRAGNLVLIALLTAACDKPTGTEPAKPTSIEIVTATPATSIAGVAVATAPTFIVKDQNGASMANVPVTVTAAGGGSVSDAPTATLASGPTPVGTWILAQKTVPNTLTIAVEGLTPAILTVQGVAGPAAKLVGQDMAVMLGTVAEASPLLPQVRVTDAFDNIVPGAVVAVSVTGGGTTAPSITADAEGVATVTSWTLGTIAGPNTITLTVGSGSSSYTVTATPGKVATIAVVSGHAQTGPAGATLAQPVVFSASDRFGNAISRSDISLLLYGDGSVSTATDAQGRTEVTWTLGRSDVPQRIEAEVGGLTAAATATVRTDFDVEVRFVGPRMSEGQQAAFAAAAARVRGMITGDLQDATTGGALDLAARCGNPDYPTVNEVVDDIVIYASARSIDGPGNLLGRAGPCIIRGSGSALPVYGIMEFDADDLASLERDGALESVILHEMLHVIGVGSYWEMRSLLRDKDLSTVAFTGTQARQQCLAEGGALDCTTSVPVENSGGAGTRNSHWRETVFDTELMTGYTNPQLVNGRTMPLPLSRMTIGSLLDIGYTVNFSAADEYRIPGASLMRDVRRPGTQLHEAEMVLPRYRIGRDGRLAPLAVQ